MDEILLAVKNKEIDEESALDILAEFIDDTKIIKVKNLLKLLSKGSLSLENASKMINAMTCFNSSDNAENTSNNSYMRASQGSVFIKKSNNRSEVRNKQNRAARPLEKEEYDKIMDLCKNGFEYYDDGRKRKFRPNEQLAMTFLLQANLGLRISDVLKLTPSTLKNDKLEIIEKKTGKLQYRDINKNLILLGCYEKIA